MRLKSRFEKNLNARIRTALLQMLGSGIYVTSRETPQPCTIIGVKHWIGRIGEHEIGDFLGIDAVSYTHLTLPTILRV